MRRIRRLSMLVIVVVAGCGQREAVSKLPQFHGKSRAQVVSVLGEPAWGETFAMSEVFDELRCELQNTYPLSNPANANVKIEEMRWQEGDFWITLWLHQVDGRWVVLDSCRWHKDVQF